MGGREEGRKLLLRASVEQCSSKKTSYSRCRDAEEKQDDQGVTQVHGPSREGLDKKRFARNRSVWEGLTDKVG